MLHECFHAHSSYLSGYAQRVRAVNMCQSDHVHASIWKEHIGVWNTSEYAGGVYGAASWCMEHQ